MKAITPHDLRHTCASLAVSAEVNVLALQRMLGHTSAKVTLDTYSDLFEADLALWRSLCIPGINRKVCSRDAHEAPQQT